MELEIADVVSKLQTVEQRLKQQPSQQMQEHAMAARYCPTGKVCWSYGRPGHISKACFKNRHDDRAARLAALSGAVQMQISSAGIGHDNLWMH